MIYVCFYVFFVVSKFVHIIVDSGLIFIFFYFHLAIWATVDQTRTYAGGNRHCALSLQLLRQPIEIVYTIVHTRVAIDRLYAITLLLTAAYCR